MLLFWRLTVAALALTLAAAVPSSFSEERAGTVEYPANLFTKRAALEERATDPFYTPPAGYESTKPGTVLRSRSLESTYPGFWFLPAKIDGYQVLYRTTAVNGSAIATATTIFVPPIAQQDRLISYQTFYDSAWVGDNPSNQLVSNGAVQGSSVWFVFLNPYFQQSWTVTVPDYEGPDSAFSAGRLSGRAVLDAIRATGSFLNSRGLQGTSNPQTVGVGYSGGAIGTIWAATLHSSYASELNIKGWASGGTSVNATATLLKLDGGDNSGFEPIAISGLSKPSPYGAQLNPVLNQYLTAYGKATVAYTNSNPTGADQANFKDKSIFKPDFQTYGSGLLSQPIVSAVLKDNTLGIVASEKPTVPVYMFHGAADEIIPYQPARDLADRWCAAGASVQFKTWQFSNHEVVAILHFGDVVWFAISAFGNSANVGCPRV